MFARLPHVSRLLRHIACALLVLGLAPAQASFEEATALHKRGDFAAAQAEFRRLAEIGDHDAQFNLAVMLFRGEGGAPDLVQAYAWMALAALDGNAGWRKLRDQLYARLPDAQKPAADTARAELIGRLSDDALARQLAPVLGPSGDTDRGPRRKRMVTPSFPVSMRREGRSGTVEVVFSVAADGTTRFQGVREASSVEFATAAAAAVRRFVFEPALHDGRPVEYYGMYQKFIFHIEDSTVDENSVNRLVDDLRGKAEKGGATEAYHYAETLEVIASFSKLPDRAGNPNQWFWKAASLGSPAAEFALGNNLLYGRACTADAVKGIKWLQKSAEAGQAEAQYVLAIDMLTGQRLAQDRAAARKWLERAASGNFAAAKLKLAWLLATDPDPARRDPARAQAYLKDVSDHIIDTLSLREVGAAVAAASGDFSGAARLQQQALDEADSLDLPLDGFRSRLKTYQDRKVLIDAS